jgi:hypothetical protein
VKLLVVVAIALVGVGPAHAGPLADALARHGAADVVALRARVSEPAARCTLGAIYARQGDLPRAALYLADCADAALPDEVGADIRRLDRDVRKRLRDSDLAVLEIITRPEHMTGSIDALPGEQFPTPATIYVRPGRVVVRAVRGEQTVTSTIVAEARTRAVVILEAPAEAKPREPGTGTVDFVEENAGDTHAGPPPDLKHRNMIRDKFLRGVAATGSVDDSAGNPDAIADPLAVVHRERGARPLWLGVRLGGGVFDAGGTAARPGAAIAAVGRIGGPTFAAARVDFTRRADVVDTIGIAAGAGYAVIPHLAVIAQLRGDVYLGDAGAGLSAALAVELALPRSPFSAALRLEHGLTAIDDATGRDRALVFEVGADWR